MGWPGRWRFLVVSCLLPLLISPVGERAVVPNGTEGGALTAPLTFVVEALFLDEELSEPYSGYLH